MDTALQAKNSVPWPIALAPVLATPEDIQANREGRISPSQRAMLEGKADGSSPQKSWRTPLSCLGIVAMPFLLAFACSFLPATGTTAEGRWMALIPVAVVVPGGLLVWSLGNVLNRRMRDLAPHNRRLQVARGAVSKRTVPIDGIPRFAIDVGSDRFFVGGRVYDAFAAGDVYCVYYLLPGRIMLSFEPDDRSAHPYRGPARRSC